jgi:hypothetical protein
MEEEKTTAILRRSLNLETVSPRMDFCLASCLLNPVLIAYSVGPRFPQLRLLHLGHREFQPLPFVVAAAHGCLALIPFRQSSVLIIPAVRLRAQTMCSLWTASYG